MPKWWDGDEWPEGLTQKSNTPLFYDKQGKWYFCDETWGSCHGPYDTLDEANKALDAYCETL